MQKQAAIIKTSLVDNDAPAASRALAVFAQAAEDARSKTSTWGWQGLGLLPIVGKNFDAVATVSDVSVDVAANAIGPAVDEAKGSITRQLTPHDGRVDLPAVERLQGVLGRIDASLTKAADRVGGLDTGGMFSALKGPLDKLKVEVIDAQRSSDSAYRASRLIPTMLGGSGTRHYLLLFDNNAEVRATGGMPGAWAILTASHGKVSMTTQGTAAQVGEFPQPILPQSDAEKAIYYDQIATFSQDTNFTPEFPRTATLLRAMWLKKYNTALDGVMSVDAVSLGNFLEATGPVTVDGVTLTAANAADELLNRVYLRYADSNAKQDAFFKAAAQTIFTHVMKSGSPIELAKAFGRSVDEGRVYLHSFEPSEQAILGSTAITSLVNFEPTASPQMGVYLNDATGSKMSYYLRDDVTAKAVSCDNGRQSIQGSAVLSMIKPNVTLNRYITGSGDYGTPVGQQTVLVRFYGPVGGTLGTWTFDGEKADADIVMDRGRPVATFAVQLAGGDKHTVTWVATSGAGQTKDGVLQVTPGMVERPAAQPIASACS